MSELLPEGYSILESTQENLTQLSKMKSKDIAETYIANLLAACLLLKSEDKRAKLILKDIKNKSVKKYDKNMSPVNFWGWVVHRCGDDDKLKELLDKDTYKELKRLSGRILETNIKKLHWELSEGKKLDWEEINEQIRIMTLRLNIRQPKVNKIRDALKNWDALDKTDVSQDIRYAYYYLRQHDPNSILIPRMMHLQNTFLLHANDEDDKTVVTEEGEGAGPVASAAVGTTSSAVAPVPFKLFRGKTVKKKKKKFTRRNKFIKKKNQ